MNTRICNSNPVHRNDLWAAALAALIPLAAQGATNVFSTQFEAAEGYDVQHDLVGQGGWLGEGSGGNGLVTDFYAGQGQQAYIGYTAPASTNEDQLVVWRPLGFDPLAASVPLVKFSVLMSIADSSTNSWDNFRWSVYNHQTNRLFSLDFDNYYRDVSYLLDGTNTLTPTPVTFTNDQPYWLTVAMNFRANRWSASFDNQLITTNQPITTVNATLNLGEIDAIWLIFDPQYPGDNYMVFDNLQITADALAPPRPRLTLLGRTGSQTWLRLNGQSGTRFTIEASTNFTTWTALKTNVTSDGSFDFVDTAATSPHRFYRARWVP